MAYMIDHTIYATEDEDFYIWDRGELRQGVFLWDTLDINNSPIMGVIAVEGRERAGDIARLAAANCCEGCDCGLWDFWGNAILPGGD